MKVSRILGVCGFALVVLLSGCGRGQGRLNMEVKKNTGVHGKWSGWLKKYHADGTSEKTVVIQPDQVGLEVKCTFSGDTLYASAISKAEVTSDKVIIKESSRGETIINGKKCTAELGAGTLQFTTAGNTLFLGTEILTRE